MTLTTTRPDLALTYHLEGQGHGHFEVTSEGDLVLAAALDYEEVQELSMTVVAGLAEGGKNTSANVNITLLDVNDWQPVFGAEMYR